MSAFDTYPAEQAYRELIGLAEGGLRDGTERTPARAARAWRDLTSGYEDDPANHLTVFDSDGYDELIAVRDIPVYSLCEHHLLPFIGRCHVAYLPTGKILGLSKVVRIVNCFARRLQVQERLTMQIADALDHSPLAPLGVAVVIEAEHLCMTMRGVHVPGTTTTTSVMRGAFRENESSRAEAMSILVQR